MERACGLGLRRRLGSRRNTVGYVYLNMLFKLTWWPCKFIRVVSGHMKRSGFLTGLAAKQVDTVPTGRYGTGYIDAVLN